VENGALLSLAGPNEGVNTHGLNHRANRRTSSESLRRAVLCQGRTGKILRTGVEEQVGTSGEASVQGLAWPGGEPRSAVMLVRLPMIFQGAEERFP
jgi:hypothetical protein